MAAKAFYERHGGKAIVLARFVPLVRTFTPFVAGVARMSYRRFALYNIVGGAAWVLSMSLAGFWLGRIPWVQRNFEMVVIGGIVVVSRAAAASRGPSLDAAAPSEPDDSPAVHVAAECRRRSAKLESPIERCLTMPPGFRWLLLHSGELRPREDPVVRSGRRGASGRSALWLAATIYSVTYCTLWGYKPPGRKLDVRPLVSRLGLLGHRGAVDRVRGDLDLFRLVRDGRRSADQLGRRGLRRHAARRSAPTRAGRPASA